mgnify:CR=1 FL=1
MKIKEIAIGNNKVAFVENRFTDGVNIIYSSGNNKGKTIVVQSILYALGNVPTFPSTFDYQNYYYIVTFENNDKTYQICRKRNNFFVKQNHKLIAFDTLSEFKYYINQNNIYKIPEIIKDKKKKLVDPELLFQTFFLGQDKKDTSTIINNTYYKKEDYYKTIYSLAGISSFEFDSSKIDELEVRLAKLLGRKKELEDKNLFLKSITPTNNFINSYSNLKEFQNKIIEINKLKDSLASLSNERSRLLTQKTKNEITLKELNSLNREIKVGKLKCLDCNSDKIGYESADKSYTFDICNLETRKNIITSIETKINIYEEEIEKLNLEIESKQKIIKELLKDEEINIDNLILYKKINSQLTIIEKEIESLQNEKENCIIQDNNSKKQAVLLNKKIVNKMNEIYNMIDASGNLYFESIFSKPTEVYSGSEAMEYYICKLISIAQETNHSYPIIIDAFRDGELETSKENKVLDLFKQFSNQVILTATLKEEENNKYDKITDITTLDYSSQQTFHLLQPAHVPHFMNLLNKILP